jgi:hypothetical protein
VLARLLESITHLVLFLAITETATLMAMEDMVIIDLDITDMAIETLVITRQLIMVVATMVITVTTIILVITTMDIIQIHTM